MGSEKKCFPSHLVPSLPLVSLSKEDKTMSRMSAVSRSSAWGGSVISLDRFSNFEMDDLANLSMDDQRWTLNREKIGLTRKTKSDEEHRSREKQTRDINLSFICNNFTRKECVRYVRDHRSRHDRCYCGLTSEEHLPITELIPRLPYRPKSSQIPGFETVIEDPEGEAKESNSSVLDVTKSDNGKNMEAGMILSRRSRVYPINAPTLSKSWPLQEIPPVDSKWDPKTHLRELPTNAYGRITFTNETSGSNKPSKYVRLADTTNTQNVLTLLTDYWRMMEPQRPQLVISVTGGAKNFRLDGKKNEIFSSGLIKAVKSTDAWLLTGGGSVGVTMSVGQAVNQGQYITKVKRKTFSMERDHMVRGIRCIGVIPWGYTDDRDLLVCPDPCEFANVKYKVKKTKFYHPVSLDGDHTHFLLVDDGSRNSFSGADDFRTRLEEAIQEEEPDGLGVPVVLLVLEGGMSALEKCAMALSRNIPVVVVAGTGRAADLIAYAVSLTIRTPRGDYVFRKGHEAQLMNRISVLMPQLHNKQHLHKECLDRLLECCKKTRMITIFDINSNEGLDKYILYALMTCKERSQSSRQDQLGLALLWNRPDIAETQIFPAEKNWSLGALEDLMTTALLEEKVEFVNLFVMNGLVMEDYLTVGTLRFLYNQACVPNSHLSRLLQISSNSWSHSLIHVHNLLNAMMKKHFDKNYLVDTPENITNNPNISAMTFEDPYLELMLWAVFSRRGKLARFLWERCNSPLCAAVVASCIYQALWKTLGKKNTDTRQEYQRQKKVFETLADELLNVCYQEDPIIAMDLIERRNAKWGQLDCLELAYIANDLIFISAPCSQATVELNWRRGMTKAPYSAVIIANFFPLLIFWPKLFQFQKLGDNGGELTAWQKLIVYYKSPISKFYAHTTSYVSFLVLYSYVIMFDFKYEMSAAEILVVVWIGAVAVEKVSEICTEQSSTNWDKLKDWSSSVWSRFDLMAVFLAFIALVLRLIRSTFRWGRVFYAVNTIFFYCRLFRMYHVNYHLGPKLVIFYRMITEVLVFMALLVIFILGYGIASQSLLHPSHYSFTFNVTEVGSIFESVILTPYWQMYGELLLDEIVASDHETCHEKSCLVVDSCLNQTQGCLRDCVCENPTDYKWVVKLMLFVYLIIGNIMLLNLLIAIFTYVFDEVQENSMEIWKFEMYRLIREYEKKPILVLPFVVVQHFWQLFKAVGRACCVKTEEEPTEYETDSMMTLRLIEKEATLTFLARIHAAEENSLQERVKRMSDKIDRVTKYIDQKEEMEQIEGDMEWVIGKPEDLQEMQNNKDGKTQLHHPLVSPRKKTPQPSRKNSPRDQDECYDVLGDEVSDNEIESELAHLFNKVESIIPPQLSRTNTPLARPRRMNEVQRIYERMDALEVKLNTFQSSVSQALEKILDAFDKDAKQKKTEEETNG